MGCPYGFGGDLIHQNRGNTNEDFTIRAGANSLRGFLESIRTRKEVFNCVPEPPALDGRCDAATVTDKKGKSDRPLKVLDQPCHTGLREGKGPGSLGN